MRIFRRIRISPTGLRLVAVVGLAVVLGACHGTDLERVQGLEPQGSEFNQRLFAGFVELSANELEEFDYVSSDRHAARAAAVARGDDVTPSLVDESMFPEDKAAELSTARVRLVSMLAGGGRDKAPAIAARAQINFECWLEEQDEGHQPTHIADCRNAFYDAVVAAEVATRPPQPAPESEPATEPAPDPAIATEPDPEPEPGYATYYVLFFDFDSSALSRAAMTTLDEAAAAALEMRPHKIVVRGHTDRAGPEAYNLGLSDRRALSAARYLIDRGAGRFAIETVGLGEAEPIARTSDDVRDGRNRRVEVLFSEAG